MKDILRLPILFILVFILLFLLFFALGVLALWGGVYSEGPQAALRVVEASIPALLRQVLPAAVLLSLVILLARISARPGSRLLSLIIPLAGAFVLLAFGYQLLAGWSSADGAAVVEATPRRYLAAGAFNQIESKVIYIEDLEGSTASPIVVAEGGNADQKLIYFPQGRVELKEDAVALRMAGYRLEMDPIPVFSAMFAGDSTLMRFNTDLDFLNREIERTFELSLPAFYFTVLALVIAFYGSGLFLRLTRWHLLNVALNLLVLRGFLALFRFLGEGVGSALEKALSNPQALQFLPELVLLVLGGLMVLLDLLFVPFRRWVEE